MRRDVCYFFPTDVASLFDAYVKAAVSAPFERECKPEPYHTINFGLNFSLKYNMNGGACILHFMPLPDGAAVDLHFIIAQAFGARYEAYAEELTRHAAAILGVQPMPAEISVELFMKEENKVSPAPVAVAPAAPVAAPTPTPAPVARFCTRCGNPIGAGDRFCTRCGNKL